MYPHTATNARYKALALCHSQAGHKHTPHPLCLAHLVTRDFAPPRCRRSVTNPSVCARARRGGAWASGTCRPWPRPSPPLGPRPVGGQSCRRRPWAPRAPAPYPILSYHQSAVANKAVCLGRVGSRVFAAAAGTCRQGPLNTQCRHVADRHITTPDLNAPCLAPWAGATPRHAGLLGVARLHTTSSHVHAQARRAPCNCQLQGRRPAALGAGAPRMSQG